MDNFSDVYLFAPDLSAVQALVLSAMESRIAQGHAIVEEKQRGLSYSEVSQFLLTMESTCQPHGIQGLVTSSVASTRAVPDGAAAKTPTDATLPKEGKTGANGSTKPSSPLLLRSQAIKIVPRNQ